MALKVDESRKLIVHPTSIRILAWIDITLFLFAGVMSWRSGGGWPTYLFFGFVLLGVYLLTAGSVEMDPHNITYRTPIGTYRIRWEEISRIESDRQAGSIVFWGEDKRLSAIGPGFWSGKDKAKMLIFLKEQVEKYRPEVVVTEKAMFRLTKNTKVSV